MFGFLPLAKSPVADDSGIVNYHIGISDAISTPTVSVDIVQTHIFGADEITASAPVVDTAPVFEDETFAIADITIGTPTIGAVNALLRFDLTADDITVGVPTIGTTPLYELWTIDEITLGAPVVDQAVLTEVVNFGADSISVTPVVENAPFTQEHVLSGDDITAGVPTLPVRFLWDFQEIEAKTWTEVSDITDIWTDVPDPSDTWSDAA